MLHHHTAPKRPACRQLVAERPRRSLDPTVADRVLACLKRKPFSSPKSSRREPRGGRLRARGYWCKLVQAGASTAKRQLPRVSSLCERPAGLGVAASFFLAAVIVDSHRPLPRVCLPSSPSCGAVQSSSAVHSSPVQYCRRPPTDDVKHPPQTTAFLAALHFHSTSASLVSSCGLQPIGSPFLCAAPWACSLAAFH
jgi:hypothetical protein